MEKYTIDEIMDLKEVADKYDFNLNTLRSICNNNSHGLIEESPRTLVTLVVS